MPVVPSASNFRVSPTASAPQFSTGPNAIEVTGRQAQQTGAALMESGRTGAAVATDFQAIADQVKINDAVNEARGAINTLTFDPQVGYRTQRGNAAITRDSGKFLPDEYGEKLESTLANIAQRTLSTESQRRAFSQSSGAMVANFRGAVQAHAMQEFQSHRVSGNDGTITLAENEAKLYWNEPDRVWAGLDAAKAANYDKGQALGWSAAQTDASKLAITSGVHRAVVMSALENSNPTYALQYLERNKGEISADDLLRVRGQVNESVYAGQAMDAVEAVTTKMRPQIFPNNFDRLVNITGAEPAADLIGKMVPITVKSESGGRRYGPDGKTLLTSSAGAKGEMQVLDSTMQSPGLGLKGLPADATPDQRAEQGRKYLGLLLQRYGGDPAKAWAAYNAGYGRLDKVLKEAAKDVETGAFRGGVPADLWLQKMPAETRAYVAKNMKALGSSGGYPERPSENDFVSAAVAQLPAGSPARVVAITRDQASKQYALIERSLTDKGNNALTQGQQWLAGNGGDITRMPVALRDAVVRYAPAKLDELTSYAKAVGGSAVETNLALYNRLSSSPEALAAMPDAAFEMLRSQLDPVDFKHFARERGALLKVRPSNDPGELNTPAINGAFANRLLSLGVKLNPGDGTPAAIRLGSMRKLIHREIYDMQRQAGKKFNDEETEQAIDKIFARSVELQTRLWERGDSNTRPILAMKAGEIPDDIKDRLVADFKRQGYLKPTDEQVLEAYQAGMLIQKRARQGTY